MSNPYDDDDFKRNVVNPSLKPNTYMNSPYAGEFTGKVINPSSKPYPTKTKVRQVMDADGNLWYESYQLIEVPLTRVLAHSVTNGDDSMTSLSKFPATSQTKITLTSRQQLDQIIKNL
jgi:hypothetical protein